MSESDRPNHFRIDTSMLSPEQRLYLARHFLGPGFNLAPLDNGQFDGAAEFWLFDGISAVHDQDMSCQVARMSDEVLHGSVRLRLVTSGRLSGIVDGHRIELRKGDIALDATNVTVKVELEDFSCKVLGMKMDVAGYDPALHPAWMKIPRDAPEGAIIADGIRAFFDRLATADREMAERLAKVMVGLFRGFLASLPAQMDEGERRQRARLRAMSQYLEENLAEPSLGIDDLLREFNTSRAVVYRLFSDFGGVAKYLTERRLIRAMSLLTARPGEITRIAGVAEAVGYRDQRRFARAFRRRFGITPSQARQALGGAAPDTPGSTEEIRAFGRHFRTIVDRIEGR